MLAAHDIPFSAATTSRIGARPVGTTGRRAIARGFPPAAVVIIAIALLGITGCNSDQLSRSVAHYARQGQFGHAREKVHAQLTTDRGDRNYMLDRMRLMTLTLADGYAGLAQPTFEEVYDILRTQGINKDRTVASVVVNEDQKFWKGEPFEQALALSYYAMQQATRGNWDNARAASDNALFNLRDFSEAAGEDGKPRQRIDTEAILRRSVAYERAVAQGKEPPLPGDTKEDPDFLNSGYAVRESNFTLGYLLKGVAAQQLGRAQEASDHFAVANQIDAHLVPLTRDLRRGEYNTVFVVGYGIGPRKIGYGPDNALARFVPRTRSDRAAIVASLASPTGPWRDVGAYPVVTDVNRMARDHMWNSLEDVRRAKSLIGTGLLTAGAITTGIGVDNESAGTAAVGVGLVLAGAYLKATAHADVRHNETFAQRYYVVPMTITEPNTTVHFALDDDPRRSITLPAIDPPTGVSAQFRFVQMVASSHADWQRDPRLVYENEFAPNAVPEAARYPYILGGRSVAPPTATAMQRYHAAGHLTDMTYLELQSLMLGESLHLERDVATGPIGRHVLEGGTLHVTPLPGTTGFVRLFGQPHPPYSPRTPEAQQRFSPYQPPIDTMPDPSATRRSP